MVVPVLMICCQVSLKPKTGPGKQYNSCPFFEAAHVDHVFRARVVLEGTVRQTAGSMSLSA